MGRTRVGFDAASLSYLNGTSAPRLHLLEEEEDSAAGAVNGCENTRKIKQQPFTTASGN